MGVEGGLYALDIRPGVQSTTTGSLPGSDARPPLIRGKPTCLSANERATGCSVITMTDNKT